MSTRPPVPTGAEDDPITITIATPAGQKIAGQVAAGVVRRWVGRMMVAYLILAIAVVFAFVRQGQLTAATDRDIRAAIYSRCVAAIPIRANQRGLIEREIGRALIFAEDSRSPEVRAYHRRILPELEKALGRATLITTRQCSESTNYSP